MGAVVLDRSWRLRVGDRGGRRLIRSHLTADGDDPAHSGGGTPDGAQVERSTSTPAAGSRPLDHGRRHGELPYP